MIDGANVQGGDQLAAALHAAARKLGDLADTEQRAAGVLADKVQTTAPRRTGYLAEHVTAADGRVVIGAPYAVYVNARDPFLARARAAVLDDVARLFTDDVTSVVATIGGSTK